MALRTSHANLFVAGTLTAKSARTRSDCIVRSAICSTRIVRISKLVLGENVADHNLELTVTSVCPLDMRLWMRLLI